MPQYRLFLVDKQNHIVAATERECAEGDIKVVARNVLQSESGSIDGVEIWHGSRRLDHVRRS